MMATIILGFLIGALVGHGLYRMYKSFAKGKAACCSEECSGCGGGCSTNKNQEDNYSSRVEKIKTLPFQRTISIKGMTCEKCVAHVTNALEKIDGVSLTAVSLEKQSAIVGLTKNIADDELRIAIENLGYTVESIV